MPTEATEADQPPRKRADSVPIPSQPTIDGDAATVDEDDPSVKTHSGEHSADEAIDTVAGNDEPVQQPSLDRPTNVRKQTRSSSRKLKGADETADVDLPIGESLDGTAPEEDEAHTGEDEHMEIDVDEEAEAAQKTKKNVWQGHWQLPWTETLTPPP